MELLVVESELLELLRSVLGIRLARKGKPHAKVAAVHLPNILGVGLYLHALSREPPFCLAWRESVLQPTQVARIRMHGKRYRGQTVWVVWLGIEPQRTGTGAAGVHGLLQNTSAMRYIRHVRVRDTI